MSLSVNKCICNEGYEIINGECDLFQLLIHVIIMESQEQLVDSSGVRATGGRGGLARRQGRTMEWPGSCEDNSGNHSIF